MESDCQWVWGFFLGWWKCCKTDCGCDCPKLGVKKVELPSPPGEIDRTCTVPPQRTFSTNLSHTLVLFYTFNLAEGFKDHNSELSLEICFVNSAIVTWPCETLKRLGLVSTNTMLTCHLTWFLGSLCSQGMGLLNNCPLDHSERP